MSLVLWLLGFVASMVAAVWGGGSIWILFEKRESGEFTGPALAGLVMVAFSLAAMYCGSHAAYEIWGPLN